MSGNDRNGEEETAAMIAVLAGVATEEERAAAEALEAAPGGAARRRVAETAREALAAAEAEEAAEWSPGEIGLRRLLREVEREERAPDLGAGGAPTTWFDSTAVWRSIAAAALIALLVVSSGAFLGGEPGGAQRGYEVAGEKGGAAAGALAQVTFAAEAKEAEIRALLLRLDARMADGPSALGVYRVAFRNAAARDDGLEALKSAAIVEFAAAE